MMGPCVFLSCSISARAAGVADTRPIDVTSCSAICQSPVAPPPWIRSTPRRDGQACAMAVRRGDSRVLADLEEAQCLLAVADQHVLSLLIMIQHHLVSLASDAGFLIAAECRVRRIRMIAVGPNASGLDAAAKSISGVQIARPHAGAESVQGVVGDLERLFRRVERGHRYHRPEDFP